MAVRSASAEWQGDLKGGNGTFSGESGEIEGAYSFGSRFAEEGGTNPEELIGAAHASCFSMQFSAMLAAGGNTPESIRTEAKVQVLKEGEGFAIKKIDLTTTGRVPGSTTPPSRRPLRLPRRAARCRWRSPPSPRST